MHFFKRHFFFGFISSACLLYSTEFFAFELIKPLALFGLKSKTIQTQILKNKFKIKPKKFDPKKNLNKSKTQTRGYA